MPILLIMTFQDKLLLKYELLDIDNFHIPEDGTSGAAKQECYHL